MICEPCRPVHSPADCIDSVAGRAYPWRHCVCQHQPREGVPADVATRDDSASTDD